MEKYFCNNCKRTFKEMKSNKIDDDYYYCPYCGSHDSDYAKNIRPAPPNPEPPKSPVMSSLKIEVQGESNNSISLRDYFAGQAMNGFIINYAVIKNDSPVTYDKIVEKSYVIADKMLKERIK